MPAREHKLLQLYNSFALLSATAERTSRTMQRDTTLQPKAHRVGGFTKPNFEWGGAILVKKFGPIIPYMSENL